MTPPNYVTLVNQSHLNAFNDSCLGGSKTKALTCTLRDKTQKVLNFNFCDRLRTNHAVTPEFISLRYVIQSGHSDDPCGNVCSNGF